MPITLLHGISNVVQDGSMSILQQKSIVETIAPSLKDDLALITKKAGKTQLLVSPVARIQYSTRVM